MFDRVQKPIGHTPEQWAKIKERIAGYLRDEFKTDVRSWFYISVTQSDGTIGGDKGKFVHGVYIRAYGPTDAWRILHTLNLVPENATTRTTGPLSDEKMDLNVPEGYRWRPLSKEELNLPGQEKLDAEGKS